ncbi:aldehyde dehydrogenase family protein [Mycobacterium paraintracellulare]|uniref:aldehyde dehydrogenase family protein n=1 Tax=Mycobacterium paraintracellulare TaxID=1138383 RepID=UPI001916C733|nr:aldehyde dehydrogenase family protein [Mycobacterium paraintracellulare]WVL46290.1 aldehyde dehydrogenase family protein [Mycobacterium paraintracellulare]BCO42529.1 betaine-aldehyde dehydrogenase [Mycobacterium paraintracellulare]
MTATASSPTLSGALLIGGERITAASGGTYRHVYPGTGLPNASIPLAGRSEVDRAVDSAWDAHREWMSYPVDRRRDLLFALADVVRDHFAELSELNVHDYGVPIAVAGNSVLTERFLRYYAGYVDKSHGASTPVAGAFDVNIVEREPYGVVGVLAPWNGPLVVVGAAVAPALAAGNAVILKPSEVASLAPLRFGELCLEAGLPPGLVNVLPAGPKGGDALVRHPGVRKIHFTGGQATAQKVLQAASHNLTPVTAELGGKSAYLVFADADLDMAAVIAAHQGPITQAGQSCACASRILVHASVYTAFVEKLAAAVRAAKVGDPLQPDVMLGPVVSEAAAERILGVIDQAVSEKAGDLITGGRRLGGELASGYFIEPTIFANVDNRSALAQTETFGPVASVMPFGDEDEAVRIANDSRYGLNAFVATSDLERAHRVARRLEAGSVWVNRHSDIAPQGPYGGYKQSGFGRTGGVEGLYDFLQVKNIRIGMS